MTDIPQGGLTFGGFLTQERRSVSHFFANRYFQMNRSAVSQPTEHNVYPVYRPDIDGLRAVAILSVVIYHAFPSALPGGFVGVDVFFVISGFLISTIIFRSLLRGDFSFTEFYIHRIKRIIPALIVVLSACYAFGWFALLPDEFKQLGKHIAAGAGFLHNFILWQEVGYFDTVAEQKPLMHLWSLAIEEQFYLIFPVLIFAVLRTGLNVMTVVLSLGLISFGLNISGITANPTGTFFMPQTRVWELLVGSALAYLQLFKREKFFAWMQHWMFHPILFRHAPPSARRGEVLNNLLSVVALLLLVAAIFIIDQSKPFPGWWALLPVSGASLLILATPEALVNRVILANRLMVFAGLISYPLYLWHWPILSFTRILEFETPTIGMRIAAVALSFVLAWLTYRLIEIPVRFGRKSWIKTAVLSIVLVLVGYIGCNTFQRDGLAFRIPSDVKHIANFKYEFAVDARAGGKCWLEANAAPEGFASECIEVARPAEGHSVLVWGDSHAARLYPGLRKTLGDEVAISQLTRDSCPPMLGFGDAVCQKSNDHIISKIQTLVPTTVIMFAVWSHYQKDWLTESGARQGLQESIRKLKASGVKNIVVLGPAPHWKAALPKLLYNAWKHSFPHKIPERLAIGMKPDAKEVDEQLKEMLRSEHIFYVSVLKLMCEEDGCRTHVPGRPSELLTWDYGHLTTEGAVFVSKHLLLEGALPSVTLGYH